jgi:hypothetical protein
VRDSTLKIPPFDPSSSVVGLVLGTKASRSLPAGEGLRFAASSGAVRISCALFGDAVMDGVEVSGSAGIEGDDVVKKPLWEE